MFDAGEPIAMPNLPDDETGTTDCPVCSTAFIPQRANQKYCNRACQKNASRGSRKIENRERSWRHYKRAHDLFEMIYTVAPQERLGVMKHILGFIPTDAGLRNILTDPELLQQPPRGDGRMNIAKAANAYTQMFYGISIKRYIRAVRDGHEPEAVPLRP